MDCENGLVAADLNCAGAVVRFAERVGTFTAVVRPSLSTTVRMTTSGRMVAILPAAVGNATTPGFQKPFISHPLLKPLTSKHKLTLRTTKIRGCQQV